jgi:hypothetical protein
MDMMVSEGEEKTTGGGTSDTQKLMKIRLKEWYH